MSSAEGLQIAQIIADLQTLQNAVRPLLPSSSPPHFSGSPPPNTSPHLSCHSPSPSPQPPSSSSSTPLTSYFFPFSFARPHHSKIPQSASRPANPSPRPAEAEVNPPPQDPQASLTLLTPLKSVPPSSNGTASPQSRRNSPPKFDKLGRRIVGPISRTPPSFRRGLSSASMSSMGMGSAYGSGTATPITGGFGAVVCSSSSFLISWLLRV